MSKMDLSAASPDPEKQYLALKQPNFPELATSQGPPPFHSRAGEEQEMAIIADLAMPEDNDPVPYTDQFGTDRKYVNSISQRADYNWQRQPTSPNMNNLPPTDAFICSFAGVGALWRRFCYHDPNPLNEASTYQLRDSEYYSTSMIYLDADNVGQINFNIGVATSNYQPHGQQIVCGRTLKQKYANASWIWADAVPDPEVDMESAFTIAFPGSAAIDACHFSFVRWAGGKYIEDSNFLVFAQADATRSRSFTITVSDYYTIFYFTSSTATTANNFTVGNGITISVTSYCSQFCHVQVDEVWKNLSQIGPGCVRAASLRVTDIAAPLNIQGSCAVASTRENNTWWDWCGFLSDYMHCCIGLQKRCQFCLIFENHLLLPRWVSIYHTHTHFSRFCRYNLGQGGAGSPFKSVQNYREAYAGPLRLGGYSFHLPKDMEDFAVSKFLVIDYNSGNLNPVDVWFDLEDTHMVNVYSMSTLNTGSNDGLTGQGADTKLTIVTQFDGTVDNKFVRQFYPRISFETWMHALEVMRGIPRCMSNKWHTSTLMGFLARAGKLAKRYVVPLIKIGGRAAAEAIANESPLAATGLRLLKDAYGIGDEVMKTYANGN